MNISTNDIELVQETVKLYFTGTYNGDPDQLKRAFHTDAHITGSLKGITYDWTVSDFINRVMSSPIPSTNGEKFDKKIISLDITNNAAMVKARVKVGDLTFTDYITLLKIDGQWVIRNKSFTD